MTTSATSSPRRGAKLAAKVAASFVGNRPMTDDEYRLARYFARSYDTARSLVARDFGSADESAEFRAAREAREDSGLSDDEWDSLAREDHGLLSRYDLVSHARLCGFAEQPNSLGRALFLHLRSTEVALVRLVLALNAPPDPTLPRPNSITLDRRRFSYLMSDDRDPRNSRLIVEDVEYPAGSEPSWN